MIPIHCINYTPEFNTMPSKVDKWLSQALDPDEDLLSEVQDVFSDQSFSLLEYLKDSCNDDDVMEMMQTSFEQLDQSSIMLYDCMWTGCDEKCRSKHIITPVTDFDNLEVLPGKLSCCSDNEESPKVELDSSSTNGHIPPYTPDSDHCYSQPKHLQINLTNAADSDTGSESSDDEVDVVTVSDECGFLVGQRYVPQVRRTARQQTLVRKQNIKSRNTSHVERTVKAAASALKRTKFQTRPNVKRRKINSVETSPSSSVPSSCGSSRCNSDVEDFEKRHTHNDSERKRREAQRSALQVLRMTIPDLKDNCKAPKVLILNSASKLVKQLEMEEDKKIAIRKQELKRRKKLQSRLNALRNSRH